MRRRVQVAVVLLLVPLVGGLGVTAVGKVRQAALRMQCSDNLRQWGMGLLNHESTFTRFPVGTVPGTTLPPDRRLSWLIDVTPFMCSMPKIPFDRAKAWDAEENCPPYWFIPENKDDDSTRYHKELVGELRFFICPANPARNPPDLPCPTHYVGVAGVGPDAADLPLSDARAGLFGHDRKVTLGDVKDGQSTTMAMAEVLDGGPWTAGGRATVRGLEPSGVPYLGEGGPFGSLHTGGNFFAWRPPVVTNVVFVDGSVRGLTAGVSPELFEALATIAGGEGDRAILEW